MYLTGEIPFNDDPDTKDLQEEQAVGMNAMIVPILAGILSALRRVIARRVSLKVFTSIFAQLLTALVFLEKDAVIFADQNSMPQVLCG